MRGVRPCCFSFFAVLIISFAMEEGARKPMSFPPPTIRARLMGELVRCKMWGGIFSAAMRMFSIVLGLGIWRIWTLKLLGKEFVGHFAACEEPTISRLAVSSGAVLVFILG